MTRTIARKTVQHKRTEDRASDFALMRYLGAMDDTEWINRFWQRVDAHIERTGESQRALSRRSGLGPNFLSQTRNAEARPKLDSVEKVCEAIGISVIEILTGIPMDEEGEELIRLAARGGPSDRHHIVQILRGRVTSP